MKRGGRVLGCVALGFVALALLIEVGLRVAQLRIRIPTVCEWDPHIGCLLRPNARSAFAFGRTMQFAINAAGRRDPPRGPKRTDTPRVLLLGDSVAFGVPAPDDRTMAALLEARLAPAHVEIVNAGSPYLRGTDQQLSYFLDRGVALAPDLVLLEFSAQNDFYDNGRQLFWRLAPGGVERVPFTPPPTVMHRLVIAAAQLAAVRWLDEHSYAFGALELWWNIMHVPPSGAKPDLDTTTEALLARLAMECKRSGARLAILLVPSPEAALARQRGGPLPDDADEKRLARIAARQGIPLLDLTEMIAAAPETLEEAHLTETGQRAASELLAPRVLEWLARP